MTYTNLKELPVDHILRNTKLAELPVQYQLKDSVLWIDVKPSFGIAKVTFNQLSPVWTTWDQWRISDGIM